MIWLAAVLLALCALAPAAFALRRHLAVRGRVEPTVALHRAQLAELDRDRVEGRISPSEHATALLEVQRRLLTASAMTDGAMTDADGAAPRRWPLLAGLAAVPVAAFGLYLIGGHPNMPAQPLASRMNEADRELADTDAMIGQLEGALAKVDPHSEKARQGDLLLGNLEASRGNFAGAAGAWQKALDVRFEPLLAARVADATSRAEGHLSEASVALFRKALAAAPADAPWRGQVEQMLAQASPR